MSKITLVSVTVVKGDINRALKKYKRKVNDSGHLLELKDRKQFTKPKTVRRAEKLNAIRRNNFDAMLEKIENGDNTIRLKSKKIQKSNNTSPKSEREVESHGLRINKNM